MTTSSGKDQALDERRRPPENVDPSWAASIGPAGAAQIVVLAGLFCWLYWSQLLRLYSYWKTPDWSHGFAVPFFCLYVIHTNRRAFLTGKHVGSLWGFALIVASVGVYAGSIYAKIGTLQSWMIVPTLAGVILLMRGWRSLRLMALPLAMFILAVPPPTYRYRAITQPLQQFIAKVSTVVLNGMPGVDEVSRSGIHIAFWMKSGGQGLFTVAGACSGMRSLMAFAFLGLAIAFLAPRPVWERAILVAMVLPVAVFCNFLRVIATGALQMYGHAELAVGTAHSLLGFAMFGVGVGIFLAILWVMRHLFLEDASSDQIEAAS